MGNTLPAPDDRLERVMEQLKMSESDVKRMYSKFRHYDRDKSGTIDITEFYRMIGEKRSIFSDHIFHLVGESRRADAADRRFRVCA